MPRSIATSTGCPVTLHASPSSRTKASAARSACPSPSHRVGLPFSPKTGSRSDLRSSTKSPLGGEGGGATPERVLTETGSARKLRVPGVGLTFRDSGTVTSVPDQEYETPSTMHGVHDRFSGADLDALICE